MRFSWIALPVLMATLPVSGLAATDTVEDAEGGGRSEQESETPAASATGVPIAFLRAGKIEFDFARPVSATQARLLPRERSMSEADGAGGRPGEALVRLRALCAAGLDFAPQLSRTLTGFLSSYTTACPPPAGI